MNYCKRCTYPENHPLGITFDDEGVCSGCRVHEEKDILNWAERLNKLKQLIEPYKNKNRTVPDCIIPVSGAQDSYFITDFVKNELGLTPLCVTYNNHYNTRMGIRNLAYMRSLIGLDCLQHTVSPQKVKKITRETLRLRGSMYWHVLAGQTVFPVQTAVRFKIPLIIWGAHQGIDQVGMFSHTDEVEMTRKYRRDHDLMGLEAEELLELSNQLTKADLEPFFYPHDKEIEKIGVRGIYLNNYLRWDTKAQHEKMIQKYQYETLPQQRTFDSYNNVDSFHYNGIHDYIKRVKHGYGKITDHVTREIRLKRMTREEGIQLINKYQNVKPRDLSLFLNWLEMDEDEFYSHIYKFRSAKAWNELSNGTFEPSDNITNHVNDTGVDIVRLEKKEECNFQNLSSRDPNPFENEYRLIDRGWVDSLNI